MTADREPEVLALFRECGAILDGHFVLSSGLHSERYLQCALVLQYPETAARLGNRLAALIDAGHVDVVVGPALGGVIIAHELARALGTRSVFAERKAGMMSLRRGFGISAGARVLLVEDVVTTGESLREVAAIVSRLGGEVASVAALVDRRGGNPWPLELPLISLLRLEIPTYDPSDCPLCRRQLPIDAPGSRQTTCGI
ncbi:MAG: orotate phosphoribosyltransferase [Acidobacteria bacterium]|nr:orotate phosphoribosyltransferase [Acidobacteriota bacterium]